MKQLDETTFAAGQIMPEEVKGLPSEGVTLVINNRPDGEEPGQPAGAEIESAARAAGLRYRAIPVAGGLSRSQIDEMAEALDQADGRVLAFCRSGTRSAFLWAMARASRGADPETLIAQAAAAGYDLSPIAAHLRR